MRKILSVLSILFLLTNNSWATVGWQKILPQTSENPQAISPDVQENNNALDLMLQNYRDGYLTITLTSTSAITIGAGGVMLSNSGGSTRLMVANTSTTTMSSTNIDTGSISPSSTYYIYAYASSTTATTFSVIYSASSTSPTGITYYAQLGKFTTDGSSNFAGASSNIQTSPTPTSLGTSWTAGTPYQNLTGRTIQVICYASSYYNGSFMFSNITGLIGASSASTTVTQWEFNGNAGTADGISGNIVFNVPNGWYWEVSNNAVEGHLATINRIEAWQE